MYAFDASAASLAIGEKTNALVEAMKDQQICRSEADRYADKASLAAYGAEAAMDAWLASYDERCLAANTDFRVQADEYNRLSGVWLNRAFTVCADAIRSAQLAVDLAKRHDSPDFSQGHDAKDIPTPQEIECNRQ